MGGSGSGSPCLRPWRGLLVGRSGVQTVATVFSEKPCGTNNLQTCFDYWFVIVVARGAAKEGHNHKESSGFDQKSTARCVTACGDP